MVRKKADGWYVFTKDGSRILAGPFPTEAKAKREDAKLDFFKKQKGGRK